MADNRDLRKHYVNAREPGIVEKDSAEMSMPQHTDDTYIKADPFFGDEGEISCRKVAIRTAKKSHLCFTVSGKQDHHIQPGERYRHERALVDGNYWGEYRLCLSCMDKFISGKY